MRRRGVGSIAVMLFSVLVFAQFVSGGNSAVANEAAPRAAAQLTDYFKSTDWLADRLVDNNVVIIDVRAKAIYDAGHIPGAINIPKDRICYFPRRIIDPVTGYHKQVNPPTDNTYIQISYDQPTPAEMIDILTYNGITPTTTVAVYDTDTSAYPGRVVWTLKTYGHANAFAIDGGIDKWRDADKRKLSTTPVTPVPSSKPYTISSYHKHRLTKSDVTAVINADNTTKAGYVLLDIRTPSEYTGFGTTVVSGSATAGVWTQNSTPFIHTKNAGARPGHIPYAKFVDYGSGFFTDYLDSTGNPVAKTVGSGNVKVFKSAMEIQALFNSLGVTSDKIVYNYCEGGFRSGVATLLQLALGYSAFNYDGSCNEWSIQSSAYPIATGDGRVAGP